MLKIKLARFGKRHQPHYRIVVNEARDRRDGKYIALLGHYASSSQPKELVLDLAAYEAWLKKGAQPTDTVAALYKRAKSGNPFPEKKITVSKKAKAKLAASKAEAEAAATQPTETAPAESTEAASEATAA